MRTLISQKEKYISIIVLIMVLIFEVVGVPYFISVCIYLKSMIVSGPCMIINGNRECFSKGWVVFDRDERMIYRFPLDFRKGGFFAYVGDIKSTSSNGFHDGESVNQFNGISIYESQNFLSSSGKACHFIIEYKNIELVIPDCVEERYDEGKRLAYDLQ